eukprot:scaffold20570_cov148-Skeletonema_menzelii.AAC.5
MAGSSYGPIGSLYRAGPKPFFTRIFNPDTYDQAVLKYMAQDGCDRKEAQGNMDAFLENPQDWGFQKVSEQNGAYKKDYANANMEPKQEVFIVPWSCWAWNKSTVDARHFKHWECSNNVYRCQKGYQENVDLLIKSAAANADYVEER